MRIVNKMVYLFIVLATIFVLAQDAETQMPTPVNAVTPGAVPIDNYIYILAFIATLFIIIYAKSFKKQVN